MKESKKYKKEEILDMLSNRLLSQEIQWMMSSSTCFASVLEMNQL